MNLRPYQQECLQQILQRYRSGHRRLLISLPTGTGKTVIFAKIPEFLQMKKRMLVLAHRQELLEQAAAKFAAACPELTVGIEQAERSAPAEARIVLASVPTIGRQDSRRILGLDPDEFYLIVVDEAHHAVADSYRRIFDHFGLFEPANKRLLVGFTATPRRGDKKNLSDVFQEVSFARNLPEMVRAGYLSTVRGWRVQTSIDLTGVGSRHGDFNESELARAIDVPARNRLILDSYQKLAPGRRAIAFCANVAHVQALSEDFNAAGIRCAPIWGAMSWEERRQVLQSFHEGQLDVLTNCNVLTEGFDEPRVDCVLMARPTQSELLYAQMVGRGTRLHEHKSDLIVIDIVDNCSRHQLANLNSLFELPESLDLGGVSAVAAADELERLSNEAPWVDLTRIENAVQLTHITEQVDLFRFEPPNEIAGFTGFSWCGMPDGGFRLNLSDGEWISVQVDNLGFWRIIPRNFNQPLALSPGSRDLRVAIAAVDEFVRRERAKAVAMLTLDADWRMVPPTEKQVQLLLRRGIATPKNLTRGQASWLIGQSGGRRAVAAGVL